MGFEAGTQASRMGFGPPGCYSCLEDGIWALRQGLGDGGMGGEGGEGGGGAGGEGEGVNPPICVKA